MTRLFLQIGCTSMIRKILLVVGLLLCFYPYISKMFTEKQHQDVMDLYEKEVEEMSRDECEANIEEADVYNNLLAQAVYSEHYEEVLNPLGNGIMGILTIPKIDVKLPIYHGTSEEVLNQGVGHVYRTSLPIGGKNAHCLLAAHRGLPEATLFTRLDEMGIGDMFYLSIMGKLLSYKVCEIQTISPE